MKQYKSLLLVCILIFATSCATYYQINQEFNQYFESGQLDKAEKSIQQARKNKRTQFLYYTNRGVIDAMEGEFSSSNDWLEKAFVYGESFSRSAGDVVGSLLINPSVASYKPEDHELLLLLYYKAINYVQLQEYDAALVECRRLNQKLYELSDKYKSENKYKEDAFVHNLMGIIYEASGDVNNAFIAYRNALKIYESSYSKLFGLKAPDQLQEDLLRTAYLNGFQSELDFYERQFNKKFVPNENDGELIFFWHNGLGPVKAEWSINFAVQSGGDGFVTFANSELGMSFPFPVSSLSSDEVNGLKGLKFLRIAFPKYQERPTVFNSAYVELDGQRYDLEMTEDINAIAFKTLNERMMKELAKGLLRVAMKKVAENQLRKESEGWGAVLGAVNALTEKADTRNWQTLPHDIFYTRVPLKLGQNDVRLKTQNFKRGQSATEKFTIDLEKKGMTKFFTFQSLVSY